MYLDNFPYTENFEPESSYTFHATCLTCGSDVDVTLPSQGLFNYRRGMLVQHAFPELPKEIREMVISGICPKCFEEWERAMEAMEQEIEFAKELEVQNDQESA